METPTLWTRAFGLGAWSSDEDRCILRMDSHNPTPEGAKMNAAKLQSAMSAEEWATVPPVITHASASGGVVFVGERHKGKSGAPGIVVNPATERHALAALALHGQPFGFTHEDVRTLRMYSAMLEGQRNGNFASIADRIEALLSPIRSTGDTTNE